MSAGGSTHNEFSDQEWQDLIAAPIAAAAVISAVDYSAMSERKEHAAFATYFRRVGERYKKSPLVQAVLADAAGGHDEAFAEVCNRIAARQSGDDPIEAEMRIITQLAGVLDERIHAKDAKAYKQFVYDCALLVARAHKENPLPFANPISSVEDFHLRRLMRALRLKG